MRWTLLALVACGPKSAPTGVELGDEVRLEVRPGSPRLCLGQVPDAPPLARKDRQLWSSAAKALQERRAEDAARSLTGADHPALRSAMGIADMLRGNGPAADAVYTTLLEEWPADPCIQVTAATLAASAGRVPDAGAHASAALDARPLDPDAALLSALLQPEKDHDRVVAALQAASEADPDEVRHHLGLGVTFTAVGKVEESLPHLERAIASGMRELAPVALGGYLETGQLGPYVRLASELSMPLGDDGALANASEPEAAFRELLGWPTGSELHATIDTSEGPLRCRLLPDLAPITVANFVGLARGTQTWRHPASGEVQSGPLYDGTVFHRVIPEFMIQGGDPATDGTGGPGYRFIDELHDEVVMDRPGVLAMANSGPGTNGSQFFITEVPTEHLTGRHTVFGLCDEETVERVIAIARVPVAGADKPVEDVVIRSITVASESPE